MKVSALTYVPTRCLIVAHSLHPNLFSSLILPSLRQTRQLERHKAFSSIPTDSTFRGNVSWGMCPVLSKQSWRCNQFLSQLNPHSSLSSLANSKTEHLQKFERRSMCPKQTCCHSTTVSLTSNRGLKFQRRVCFAFF